MGRSPLPATRHGPLLAALGDAAVWHSDPEAFPLDLDLAEPHPPRLRLYVFSLVGGHGTKRAREYKVNVRLPGTREGDYGSFDYSGRRIPVVLGYNKADDVWVLWDATVRDRIKHAGNLQVHVDTVQAAAIDGWSVQTRKPGSSGRCEVIIACRSDRLVEAINRRLDWLGGVEVGECPD